MHCMSCMVHLRSARAPFTAAITVLVLGDGLIIVAGVVLDPASASVSESESSESTRKEASRSASASLPSFDQGRLRLGNRMHRLTQRLA